MSLISPTFVIRHRRENRKKCSLRGLEAQEGFHFIPYPLTCPLPSLSNYLLLSLEAEEILSPEEGEKGLILLDGTWRYAKKMEENLPILKNVPKRGLPSGFQTAYPRRQDDCSDPTLGLASIEALYIAYTLLQRDVTGLLDAYYWKEEFLKKNHEMITCMSKKNTGN
ncbi:MAG: hypothetical protein K940chlam9_01202 [Chlamydiae bacterium]|nr:hypothetical protein [Chlamydiota bacterium]